MHRSTTKAILLLLLGILTLPTARSATIFQAADSDHVVWEAEDTFSVISAAPTPYQIANDPGASGNRALYAGGANQTGSPASYALFAIRFRRAGDYSLYLRWRADKAFTDLDPNSGNSYFRPNELGDLGTTASNYAASSINNSRVPPDVNNYATSLEGLTYSVTQAQVEAGQPVLLRIGSREAGLFIDRFAMSLNPALVEADFNALDNSETDVIIQGAGEDFVAFEAERVSQTINASPTTWGTASDPSASGNQALYAAGANQTASPASYALYTLRFRSPGTYSLYLRWRADQAFTDLDPNSGNSYYRPNDLGDQGAVAANYAASSANNSRVPPAVNSYGMTLEGASYTVTQAQVDAAEPVLFRIGTREAGMFIDRFAFSQNGALTEPEFNALPNSGSIARPALTKAVGSPGLTRITVSFDRPLSGGSVLPSRFTVSGGLAVTAAVLDPNTSRDVILTTSAQTQGTAYVVTVNGVTDVNNNPIAANAQINFTAWRVSTGWITRELYFNVTGTTVAELMASPNFPDNPSALEFVRAVTVGSELQLANYGARFRGFFLPASSAAYEFYLYGDDEAALSLSGNESEAALAPVLQSLFGITAFDPSVVHTSGMLSASQRYLFEVLLQQGAAPASLGLAVRPVGASGLVDQLPLIGGSRVSTFVNPDVGVVDITQQPASATVPSGGRGRFSVVAMAPKGGTLFFQWQADGTDIPGATRPSYVTPILGPSDHGRGFRCVIGVNGSDTPSAEAVLSIGPAEPMPLQPYVGINFVGGGGLGTTPGFDLAAADVAGAVPQENFNNLAGVDIAGTQPLMDAQGSPSPVTVSIVDPATLTPIPAAAALGIGSGNTTADHAMLQGYLANNNLPMAIQLAGVPAGSYHLLVYSVGFNFNSTYEEDLQLLGGGTYPLYTVRAQHAREFLDSPVLRRMASTDPLNRASGNYVEFENVTPAPDGTLTVVVTPQSLTVGNTGYFPAVNALQLVKVVPVVVPPTLSIVTTPTGTRVSWGTAAAGFTLQTSPAIGPAANWAAVPGVSITGAGMADLPATGTAAYYRLRR